MRGTFGEDVGCKKYCRILGEKTYPSGLPVYRRISNLFVEGFLTLDLLMLGGDSITHKIKIQYGISFFHQKKNFLLFVIINQNLQNA